MPRTVDLEVPSPVKGLHYEQQSTYITPDSSPNMLNVRLGFFNLPLLTSSCDRRHTTGLNKSDNNYPI